MSKPLSSLSDLTAVSRGMILNQILMVCFLEETPNKSVLIYDSYQVEQIDSARE
jgi:predicted phage tail protein